MLKKIRILFDARIFGVKNTGIGRYSENLLKELTALGSDFEMILLVRRAELDYVREKLSGAGCKLTFVTVNFGHYSVWEQLLIPFMIYKYGPDLVHFPHFNAPFWCPAPYVVTIHDLIKHFSVGRDTTTRRTLFYFLKRLGYKLVIKRAINKSRQIIVPTNYWKLKLCQHYGIDARKITVIYEAADRAFLGPENGRLDLELVANKYDVRNKYFIYTGSLYPHKNVRFLVSAIGHLNKTMPIDLVVVCGRSVFWQRFKKWVDEAGAGGFVRLLGFVPDGDLKKLYVGAQALVQPSKMEGFDLTPMEAMAAGGLAVISDIEVHREIYSGVVDFFHPESKQQIRDCLLSIVKMDKKARKARIERGKKFVRGFSWRRAAKETLEVYNRALG